MLRRILWAVVPLIASRIMRKRRGGQQSDGGRNGSSDR